MNASPRFLLSLLLVLAPFLARAGEGILTPDAVTASSQQDVSPPINLINGSGIIGHNGQTAIEVSSVHLDDIVVRWAASPNDPNPRITYVWQEPQEVCDLVLWQGLGNVGVKEFVVTALDAEGNQIGVWTFVANEVPPVAGVSVDIPSQVFPLGSADTPLTGVSQIVLDVGGNHGGSFTALSETQFTNPGLPAEGEICVVNRDSFVRWHVPLDQKNQSLWYLPNFDVTGWGRGPACLGYETGPLCEGLIEYLTMDSARVLGTNVRDTSYSPVVHDGIRVGNVSIVAGRVAQGLQFPGDQQNYVRVRHHPELDPGKEDFTAGVWVFPQTAQAPLGIIAQKRFTGEGAGWLIGGNTEGTSVVLYLPTGETRSVALSGMPVDQWTHIGFTVDRTNQRLTGYFNGVAEANAPLFEADDFSTQADLLIMNTQAFNDFKYRAVLDEFAIWNRPLKTEEMDTLYKSGVEGRGVKTAGTENGLYANLIETNVVNEMFGVNSSIWERIPFELSSLTGIQGMTLRMHYDDGFVCYLNGVEVARRNAPSVAPPLPFNATSLGPRPDNDALTQEEINLDSFVNLLKTGTNVLAIHGLNESRTAQRFVIWPELCIDREDCRGRHEGRDFWITFPENYAGESSNPKEISVCITGVAGTSGMVEIPRLGVSVPFTLDASGRSKVFLSPILAELAGTDVIEDKGVHVTAERPVSVVGLNHINFSTDGFLALPTGMLGVEHIVLGYPNVWETVPELNGTEFGIVATTDGTTVQIIPSVETAGHPAGVPYYITLDQGQTYQLINTEKGLGDLTGTVIRSTERIAVFGGHRCANVRGGEFFCDYVIEHIPPLIHWRNQYFMGPLATRSGGDTVRILAALDNTEVRFNGIPQTTLNRGEVFETIVAAPTAITTNGPPVLVAQLSNSSDFDGVEDADPFMALVPPPDAWASAYRICAPPTGGFDKNFLNLTLPAAAVGGTTVDGVNLGAIAGATFAPIGGTGLIHAVVPVSASSPHTVLGPSVFGVIAYGFASYNFDSYGYPGGISFRDIPPNVSTPPETTIYATADGTAAVPNIAGSSTAEDNCDPPDSLTLTQIPRTATALPPGRYLVTVSTTDSADLTGTATTLLTVLEPWQECNFPEDFGDPDTEEAIWGWSADPDGDGYDNKWEWQFGGNPNDPFSFPLSGVVQLPQPLAGTGLRIKYRRRIDDPFVTYTEQGSVDLVNWDSGPLITTEISRTPVFPGGEYEEVVIEAIPTTSGILPGRYFLRVCAEGCPPEIP